MAGRDSLARQDARAGCADSGGGAGGRLHAFPNRQGKHGTLSQALVGSSRPLTFLGVSEVKIFRDDIYGHLRMVFPADHRAYQALGFYKTFPQHAWGKQQPEGSVPGLRRSPPWDR